MEANYRDPIETILDCLDYHRQRATYGAVAEALMGR